MAILNLKKVFSTCREKFCSINGAQVGRLLNTDPKEQKVYRSFVANWVGYDVSFAVSQFVRAYHFGQPCIM